MVEIFAGLPAGHELFEQYSFVSAEELAELPAVLGRVGADLRGATPAERVRFATLTLKLIDARHRLGVIDDALKAKVLAARAMVRAEIADGIAFFDRGAYNRAATLQDNILFGRIAFGQARASARLGKLIAEVLDSRDLKGAVLEVGLDFEVGVGGARLSQVQRQKLGLARTLVKRPDVLVINETIAALDQASQQRVLDGVLSECEGRTVIWVLHAAEQALRFDRVLVFVDGRLVEQGPVEELAKGPSVFAEMLKPA
jgi:ABC-type transport system involved in cytochrome bd biosynthesis fused ATPase/permease subunit